MNLVIVPRSAWRGSSVDAAHLARVLAVDIARSGGRGLNRRGALMVKAGW